MSPQQPQLREVSRFQPKAALQAQALGVTHAGESPRNVPAVPRPHNALDNLCVRERRVGNGGVDESGGGLGAAAAPPRQWAVRLGWLLPAPRRVAAPSLAWQ
eukprot:1274903-Pleurochrysis_carterae.AAC.1